jgi:hypothetical protein
MTNHNDKQSKGADDQSERTGSELEGELASAKSLLQRMGKVKRELPGKGSVAIA